MSIELESFGQPRQLALTSSTVEEDVTATQPEIKHECDAQSATTNLVMPADGAGNAQSDNPAFVQSTAVRDVALRGQ